ncbi:MAG: threonine/serine dehydratase [Actinomycetota bacterium]
MSGPTSSGHATTDPTGPSPAVGGPPNGSTVMTRDRVEAAGAVLGDQVRTTPILTVDGAEFGVEATVTLKLEFLQHSGTFKGRGALHFLLVNDISAAGVTAASGGNHGVAVAWAAAKLGHRATIFVPTISAPAKVARLRSLGAEVVQVGDVYADALAACQEHQASTGATSIHAYDAPDVVAGAGTTAQELDRQVSAAGLPGLDTVLVACGGGGLSAGVAGWNGTATQVVACETVGTAAWAEAKAAGEPVDVSVSGLAADALGATRIGRVAFDTLSSVGAASAVVDDEATASARQDLWDRFRLAVEASAAVPLAVLRTGTWRPPAGAHLGIIICGANTSPADLVPSGSDR